MNAKPMMKNLEDESSRQFKARRAVHLRCSHCPPHQGDNRTRVRAHPEAKPKYKDKRSTARHADVPVGR